MVGKSAIIEGIVQSVGFRPYVYRLARELGLAGWVKNNGGIVEVYAEGDKTAEFFATLSSDRRVFSLKIQEFCNDEKLESFQIIESSATATGKRFMQPDLPPCPDCERELLEGDARRRGHFFNSCTACGPRFSVIDSLPYDRVSTSMSEFPLCADCAAEYRNPNDRRFHAETLCCNHCGPTLKYREYVGIAAFEACVADLKRGSVVMIKGVGGYHLACSVRGDVERLREIKGRDAKPFAVMFKDVAQVELFCEVSAEEAELLQSQARPIVPIRLRSAEIPEFSPSVLLGDNRCGAFLPYTPLHELLLNQLSPIVLTSANISGAAILSVDRAALDFAESYKLPTLSNDRVILRPLEDSVAVPYQVIRRGRGLAPLPIILRKPVSRKVLAMGGDLKAALMLRILIPNRSFISFSYR